MKLGVLYLHHVGAKGGMSRSLFGVIGCLGTEDIQPFIICQRGPAAEQAARMGCACIPVMGISHFDNTAYGAYSGKRWLVLLREALYLPVTLVALVQARIRWGGQVDVIHANEFGLLVPAIVAKLLFRKPLVVHVRSLQATKHRIRSQFLGALATRFADRVIAIDSAVARSVPGSPRIDIVHNGESSPSPGVVSVAAESSELRVAIVANFLVYKGMLDFIEAARLCLNDRGLQHIRFLIFGESQTHRSAWSASLLRRMGFLHDVKSEAVARIAEARIGHAVEFRGFVQDVSEIYGNIDMVCFPSHLDAVGRPVFEAASYARPSIVALRTRVDDDAVVHGQTGLIVAEKNPRALAEAIAYFHANRAAVRSMGLAARELARDRFDLTKNAQKIMQIYRLVCRGPG
jgi:glycosyltransferase involved in cell wall biosynthesis